MENLAHIYKTTPVGHDAVLLVLDRELRHARWMREVGDGVYERQYVDGSTEIALVGSAQRLLDRFVQALGLTRAEARPLKPDEGWDLVGT